MSESQGSNLKMSPINDKTPKFTMYYLNDNITHINNSVWFVSTINGCILKPPSFDEKTYTYNYETKDNNKLTYDNSWLLSWGDLSRTQNKGKSEFLLGDNTNQQLNTSKSIVNPKLANIQNYPDGIKVTTIPENIIP